MTTQLQFQVAATFALAFIATACGGSSSSDDGGIVGSGARSSGPVTATGSRVVNGTRWDVSSASISSDEMSGFSESDLPLGRVVTIDGNRSADGLTGTATRVVFDPELRGPIDAGSIVDLGGGETEFRIFDIRIIVDSSTFFEPPALVLVDGLVVEADGLMGAIGEIRATRVELEENSPVFGATEIEAKGIARNASAGGFELDIDADGDTEVTVVLDTAPCDVPTELDPIDLDLSSQPFVEVDGILTAATTICADRVEFEDDLDVDDDDFDEFEIEGVVSGFVSLSDFLVGEVAVDASGATFEPIGLAMTLGDGDRVEVEGSISMGLLLADEVKQRGDEVRIDAGIANVSDVNPTAGTIVLLGIDITTDATTEFDGFMNLSELMADDFLEVEGSMTSTGEVAAQKVKLDTPDDVVLRAPVESVDTTSSPRRLTLLGVTFEADSPFTSFEDTTANRFFERIRPGDIVEAKDCAGSLTMLDQACEVEIED